MDFYLSNENVIGTVCEPNFSDRRDRIDNADSFFWCRLIYKSPNISLLQSQGVASGGLKQVNSFKKLKIKQVL